MTNCERPGLDLDSASLPDSPVVTFVHRTTLPALTKLCLNSDDVYQSKMSALSELMNSLTILYLCLYIKDISFHIQRERVSPDLESRFCTEPDRTHCSEVNVKCCSATVSLHTQ